MNEGIIVLGDVHGCFSEMNSLLNKKRPALVLQCGDFGFWPKMFHGRDSDGNRIKPQVPKLNGGKIFWADGNHEDFASLKNAPLNGELWENVYWQRRGSTLTLPDGRVVLFMGGAESVDKAFRTEGVDWFPEESITQADIDAIPPIKIDIVISHTCPLEFQMTSSWMTDERNSRMALSRVLERVQPKEWYFGHWHQRSMGEVNGCKWTALNMLHETGSWVWL